jgi:CRISPR/Cas system-associated exonuclease Cas4 (RecB family)
MEVLSAYAATAPPKLDHLSWSGITTYSACPRRFYYRKIAQVPEEFKVASLAFGGAIHQAVEAIAQARLEGKPIPRVDQLLARYDRAWTELTRDGPVLYAKEETGRTLRTTAERILSAYREHVISSAELTADTRIIAIEQQHRFLVLSDAPPIEMRLDLLELDGPDLIVTDLKTSRSRWNETKIKEALPQLVLYAHGLMGLLRELGAKRIVPRFVVVSKAKTPVIQVIQPQVFQADVDRLKRQVGDVWEGIRKEVFPQRTGWQCAQCPYKRRCLGA